MITVGRTKYNLHAYFSKTFTMTRPLMGNFSLIIVYYGVLVDLK